MGSSKSQTVGYKYSLGIHAILAHGPADKLLRFTMDDRLAWNGESAGGSIFVNSPNLFGGESREGGVSGTFDLEMGGLTQGPNSYLQSMLGTLIPSFRGVVGVVMRQMYLGNNPYLKKFGFRLQRIHLRGDEVAQWYDEKSAIVRPATNSVTIDGYWRVEAGSYYTLEDQIPNYGTVGAAYVATADQIGMNAIAARNAATGSSFVFTGSQLTFELDGDPGIVAWSASHGPTVGIAAIKATPVCPPGYVVGYREGNDASGPTGVDDPIPTCTPGGEFDMNPVHMIRECLTDATWGMGYHDEDIDDVAFMSAADQLYSEGMGMSLLWDRQIPIEQFINEVIKHIDAALYVDRKTGKFVLKLIRGGYDLGDLPTFNEDNIDKIENFNRREVSEMNNSVTVNYWNSITGKNASTTATDPALVQQQGAVINTTLQYPGFTNEAMANRIALRDLRALSTPLVSFTCYVDWDGRDLNIGDVIKVTWDDYGFVALPVRISGLAFGDGVSNKLKLTCMQDVFVLPEYGVIVPPDVGWEDPNQEPLPIEHGYAEELPYYELVQQLGQSVVDTQLGTEADMGVLGAAAARPQTGAINARFMVDDDGSGYEDVGGVDFCAAAELAADVGLLDTAWLLTGGIDLSQVVTGIYAKVGDEYVVVEGLTGNSLTVGRGVLDTVPQPHAAGEVVFFSDPFIQAVPTEYVASDVVDAKLLTVTGLGVAPELTAIEYSTTFDSRAIRPYAPGNFKINDEYFPQWITTGDSTLTWAHRDRVQQTGGELVKFIDGNVGPEAGITYTVRVYDEGGTLLWEETAITGTSFIFTAAMETGGGGGGDINWGTVVIRLPFDGTNGSTALVDAKGRTWTCFGNAQLDTTAPKYGTAAFKLDGSGDYATTPQTADLEFGSSNFTIECWIKPNNVSSSQVILGNWKGVNATFCAYLLYITSGGKLQLSYGVGATNTGTPSSTSLVAGVWTHVVAQRNGNVVEYYINGVKDATTFALVGSLNSYAGEPTAIGCSSPTSGAGNFFNGQIDDMRVNKGLARYSANFTPPAAALPVSAAAVGDNGQLTFELLAERDGYESWQKHVWTAKRQGYGFNYGEPYGAQAGFGLLYGQTYGA